MLSTGGSGMVLLPSGTTYVNALVFANSNNSYKLTAGPGGSMIEYTPNASVPGGGAVSEPAAYVEVVSGSHTIAANAILAGPLDVSMPGLGTKMTFTGALSGTGGLTLSGSGTLVLSGSDSYSGGTTVSAGVLEVTSATAIPPGSSLTVGAGGTFTFAEAGASPMATVAAPQSASLGAQTVPEPGTWALLAAAAACCLAARWSHILRGL
jgi:autotransporter-associated beta strand protein